MCKLDKKGQTHISAANMIRSAGILLGLFLGHAWGGITIPTDNCEWRYNTHGDWNQCFANEVAIGNPTTLSNLILCFSLLYLFQERVDLGKTSTVKMEGPAMEFIAVTCRLPPKQL